MNVLFVHEVDWLNKVVLDFHNLSELLSLLNHRVYAVDYENKWSKNGCLNMGSFNTEEIDGVSRALPGASVCLRRPGFIKIPVVSRLSAGITHYFEIQRVIKEKKIDVIMLYSVPTNGMQVIYLARKLGIPVVFRAIDILHRLVIYPVLRPVTKFLEKRVYPKADAVLAITPQYARYIIDMGAAESRVKLLLLPIDTGIFHPSVDCSEVREKWGFGEKDRVVVFIGTLYNFSGLDGFIRQFPRVIERVPEAKLLIVGDGPQRPELEKIITGMGLTKQVIIIGFQPYDTMPQYISLATVCINPFLNTDATRDIFPGKIVQYVACGRATVATPLPGITTLLPGESHGVVYADSDADIAAEVISLIESDERRHRLETAGLDYIKENHDQQKIARKLEKELEEIIARKRQELASRSSSR